MNGQLPFWLTIFIFMAAPIANAAVITWEVTGLTGGIESPVTGQLPPSMPAGTPFFGRLQFDSNAIDTRPDLNDLGVYNLLSGQVTVSGNTYNADPAGLDNFGTPATWIEVGDNVGIGDSIFISFGGLSGPTIDGLTLDRFNFVVQAYGNIWDSTGLQLTPPLIDGFPNKDVRFIFDSPLLYVGGEVSSLTLVPVPPAFFLFLSGLLVSLASMSRRKH